MTNRKGESNSKARLTEYEIREIRKVYATVMRGLCAAYKLERSHLQKIINRKLWAHLRESP